MLKLFNGSMCPTRYMLLLKGLLQMTFKQLAQDYFDQGFEPLPEYKNSGASIKKWNTIPITQDFINQHDFQSIAIRLSKTIIAIDVDTKDSDLQKRIRNMLPKEAPEKRGSKGFTLFFLSNAKSENFKHNGDLIVELLGEGKKTSIGIHRKTGKAYTWIRPLLNSTPPELTNKHLEALRTAFPKPVYKPSTYKMDYTPDLEEIQQAISFINSNDRDIWLAVGRSLYSFDSNAFQIFDTWSSTAPSYKPKDTQTIWDSFKGTSSTSISTLFWHAKQGGYVKQYEEISRHCPMFDDVKAGDTLKINPEFTPPPSLLLDITQWITKTATRKQPILSISAAISFVGMLLAHKVQAPTGLRSNIYTISIAHSGTGKDHPRKCVTNLMRYADMSSSLAEKPTSGSAIDDSLIIGDSKCLYQIDEFGAFYKNVAGVNAYQSEIKSSILSLFSEANGVHLGKSFSSGSTGKRKPPVEIFQPCLCIHASTTPNTFFDALGSSDTIDGFLNRFLLFNSEDEDPEYQEIIERNITADIKNEIDYIKSKYAKLFKDEPTIIEYSTEAREIFEKFRIKINDNRKECIAKKDGTAEAWGRCGEIAIKLALICSAGKNSIAAEAAQWGCDLSYWNSQQLVDIANTKVYDNEHQRIRNKILDFIMKKKIVSHSQAMKHFNRTIKGKEFKEFVQDLAETNEIKITNKEGETLLGGEAVYYSFRK